MNQKYKGSHLHMFELAVCGVYPDAEPGVPPWGEDDFRLALLQMGAPTERYHRREGPFHPGQLEARVDYVTQAYDFCTGHFGSIGEHGSFVPRFLEAYEKWVTQCVTALEENDNGSVLRRNGE